MVSPGGSTTIERALEAVRFPLSVTVTVKSREPKAVGVPEIVPAALRVRPAGRAPSDVQRLPPLAPDACRVCEYATPTCPLGRDAVVTVSPGSTRIESA